METAKMSIEDKKISTGKTFDIVAIGEALVDFTEAGRSLSGMRLFEQNPGGAPANLLCAAARFGANVAFIGKVGQDMHGRFLKSVLDDAGVNTSGLLMAEDVFTTLAFVALADDGEREFSFARKPGADTRLCAAEVDKKLLEDTVIFHFGSLSLTDEPAREATYMAVHCAKEAGAIISYDPNYRPVLWRSRDEAATQIRKALRLADIVKLSEDEALLLSDCTDVTEAMKAVSNSGACLTVITLGKNGALVSRCGECRYVPGYDVAVLDTTSAGDVFWGGFLYKLLEKHQAPQTLSLDDAITFADFGNAAAAICVTRRGGIPSIAARQEVEALMQQKRHW